MSPSPRPRRRRRWLVAIALVVIALVASAFAVLRVSFEGAALADKIATNLNKKMRGRIEIGAIHWESSSLKKAVTGGWVPLVFEDVRVWDDCALNSGAGALDEVRQGDPNEDCTLDDQPDPDPASKRRPRKLLLATPRITGEVDIHALMFGNHDFVIRNLWVHGGEVMIEQTREPYPLHAYDRTIVSILTAFYPRMKAGFRAGIYADAPGPIFDLRDIHIANLNATVHMTPNTSLGAMWGFGTTARIIGLDVDADPANLKNNSYLYLDPVDPLVAKFYVRLEATAKSGIVRLWDDGPRESFRMPKAGESYPPPGRKLHTSYEIPLRDIKLNRLAQLPGEWPRRDFVANTLELDVEAQTTPCEHPKLAPPDPRNGASLHVTGELYNYWDRPYDGSWNLKVDGKRLGDTVRHCVDRDFGGDQLEGTITLTGPFVANPKIGLAMKNLDYDVELSAAEEPLPLTLAEVEGSIDMVNEQGSLDKTTALIRGGKEPGEVVVAATFGVSPFNARAHVEIVKPIDVARFLPASLEPVGTLVQGRFTAVGDSTVAFALEDFDLSLGRTAKEKAIRAYRGRLFTKDQFDTVKLQKVRIEAGRTRASLDGTIDALHDFNCDPEKYCKGHDSCAACSVTRLEIDGCAPDLGYWLRRFGLPAFVESACSTTSSPGAPIVITGPLTKPKMNVATELAGLPCVDKLSILDSQFDAASGVLDIRRMKTGALGGTLEGSGRIRTGETPVIEKLNVTGRRLDPQKICGLGTLVKGTIDAVDAELAGTIVKREPLEWLSLAKVHARADKLTVLGEKFTNIAMCVNRGDDGAKCRPRKDYLDADDLAQCETGKKTGFCAVATATRDGGGIVDATVARLPGVKRGTVTSPPRLVGTVAASAVPVAILEQLLNPPPSTAKPAKASEPFEAGGVASMTLHLEGSPDAPQASGAVQLLRTWVAGSFLGDMQIAVTPGTIRVKQGTMPGIAFSGTALAGRLSVSGTLGTQAPFPVELSLGGRRIELDVLLDLQKRLPLPLPVQAWVTGEVHVRHELRPIKPVEPEAWIELTELGGVVTHRGADGRLVPLAVSAVDQDRAKRPAVSLRVTPSSIDFACRDTTNARVDCTTKLAIGPQNGKAAGTIDFRGRITPQEVAIQAVGKLDLTALEPLLETQFSCVSGTADLAASIKGSYKKPSYEASMQINGIQVTPAGGDDTILEAQSGLIKLANGSLGFTNVKLRVRDTYRGGTRQRTDDKTCAGRAGGTTRDEAGELFVKGNIELDGLTPASWGVLVEGKLSGKMLGVFAKEYVSQASGLARIQGDLLLTGKGKRPTIAGTLVFDPPPPCSAPDAKPGDCLRPGEVHRSITVLPRLLRREIELVGGSIEIETETTDDVRSYKVSVLDDLVLRIGAEGRVTALKRGRAEIRDGALAQLDVELSASALAFQQPGKLDLVLDAKLVRIFRENESSNLSIGGDLTVVDGSFRQDFDILDNTIKALRSNAPPVTPIWEASPLIGNAELDFTLDVRKFTLRSNITTIDMSGRGISLKETPRDPKLNGTITIGGGTFKMPGMRARFTRTSGSIAFGTNDKASNPELKITSEADYRDLSGQDHVITLTISEHLQNIEWNLTTSTGYNKSQTVALLLLGRNPEQLRRSLGDQVLGSNINNIDPTTNPTQGFADQIVKDLAGDWVSDLLENSLTRLTGLDVFRIEVGFGSIGLRVEKKLPWFENVNLIGTGEQTIRGNTINARAELKANYTVSVQGGFLGKNFNDPAEQDISDYSIKAVFRLLPLTMRALLCLLLVVASPQARAQPAQDDTVAPVLFDPTTCKAPKEPVKPKPALEPGEAPAVVIPISLVDFDLTGNLVDPVATVRTLLAPTMQAHTVLSDELRKQIKAAAAAIGYHVVGLGVRDTPNGKHAVLSLMPLPMIRKADVEIDQPIRSVFNTPLFEEAVKRRIQLRPGTYLPWDPNQIACEMTREQQRIEEYLQGEGYFDARAIVVPKREGNRVTIVIRVKLGARYQLDLDDIRLDERRLPPGVSAQEIREAFKRKRCAIFGILCVDARFTKLTHTEGLDAVAALFHRRQYPGVRVTSSPLEHDPISHRIKFKLTIEPRRRIDVDFIGDKPVSDEALEKQLTFSKAQSADDVEAEASARAITAYLQSRGFFEASVTWSRNPVYEANLDRLVYRITQGANRTVRQVTFAGSLALSPNRQKAEEQLLDAIATKPIGTTAKLLGAKATATAADLTADVERIQNLYKRIGYRDARVSVSAATTPAALGSAALTAALLATDRDDGVYVRFAIDAGLPTQLAQVHVVLDATDEIKNPEQLALCREILQDLAALHGAPSLARPVNNVRCIGTAQLAFREGDLAPTRDALKQRLFARARPRADVEVAWKLGSTRRAHVTYTVKSWQQLKVGKVILRGNFRTRDSIILDELRQANFREGRPLTSGALAEATRRLRNTGLFESTNVQLLDIDKTTAGSLNAVLEVTERYDYPLGLEASVGYSSFNGMFVSLLPSIKNWLGTGISLDTQGTVGFDVGEAVDGNLTFKQLSLEATLRIPQWISRRWHIPLQPLIEVNGFVRRQDTPRFGVLRTTGVTTTLSRSRSFPRTEASGASAVTGGFNYSYRLRARNVDALRPIGADDDDAQVPIDTTTGSVGAFIEWEHRNDRAGQLSPLAPEAGFRLEGQLSFAHPYLSFTNGKDTFVKASGAGSKYWPLGGNLVLRVDGRYDHGFPLGGAALLPEVERFFGGGDSTVRGYEDDRLATELTQVAVPPLDNITQIRVLPAGGNIRAMVSADAQLRIYKLLSTALFFDAGLITNQWSTVTADDVRPAIGMALVRLVTPFGAFAWERAVPLRPRLGDDPRGRWHVSFAARAQF